MNIIKSIFQCILGLCALFVLITLLSAFMYIILKTARMLLTVAGII